MRFSRLQGKKKRVRLWGTKQRVHLQPSWMHQAELGTLAHSERPMEHSIPPGKDTPTLLTTVPGRDNHGALIDLLTML